MHYRSTYKFEIICCRLALISYVVISEEAIISHKFRILVNDKKKLIIFTKRILLLCIGIRSSHFELKKHNF